MRIDLMTDLETLGTKSNAPILSIGACKFDIDTGEILSTFYFPIGWEDAKFNQIHMGRVVDAGTVAWWEQQSDEAREAVQKSEGNLTQALSAFKDFWLLREEPVADPKYLLHWSNGATFDVMILEHALDHLGWPVPWKFWNIRDVRTIVDLASHLIDKSELKFEGTKHNALDDAVHQAKYVSRMWQALKGE